MNAKIDIGQRVTSKKTGLPAVGTVRGVIDGEYFAQVLLHNPNLAWYKLYPGWTNKPVLLVQFDSPQRLLSQEEFVQQSGLPLEAYAGVSRMPYAYYPIDDLELLDDLRVVRESPIDHINY